MTVRLRYLLFALLPALAFCGTQHGSQDRDAVLLWKSIHALDRLADFFVKEAESANVDALFGLRLGQGHLRATLKETYITGLPAGMEEALLQLDDKMEECAKVALPRIKVTDPEYYKSFAAVIEQPFDVQFVPRSFDFLHIQPQKDQMEKGSALNSNTYNEQDGDQCLQQLLTTKHSCEISPECWKTMGRVNTHRYTITHTLIYLMFAEKYGCRETVERLTYPDTFETFEDRVCYNILGDFKELSATGNVTHRNWDLFMEEGLLCGSAGFEDFLTEDTLDMIVSWQDPTYGCYRNKDDSHDMEHRKTLLHAILQMINGGAMERAKRKGVHMKGGCEGHMSGLAAGILGLYLRAQLDISTAALGAKLVKL